MQCLQLKTYVYILHNKYWRKQIIDKKAKEATAKLTKQDEEAKQLYSIIARSAFTYTACA